MLNSTKPEILTAPKHINAENIYIFAIKFSNVAFILLLNVKMPCNIYKQDEFDAQLS